MLWCRFRNWKFTLGFGCILFAADLFERRTKLLWCQTLLKEDKCINFNGASSLIVTFKDSNRTFEPEKAASLIGFQVSKGLQGQV
jgi:hypothetical protein